jgi:zinc protease
VEGRAHTGGNEVAMQRKLAISLAFLGPLMLGVASPRSAAQQQETRLNATEEPIHSATSGKPGDAAPLPTAKELMSQSDDATGGLAAWSKTTTRRMKGLYQSEDASVFVAVEILQKSPNKSLSKVTMPNGLVLREVCDGQSAWIETSLGQYQEITGAALASRLRLADLQDRAKMEQIASTGKVTGIEKVGTHTAYVLEFSPDKKLLSRLYIDVDSKLVVRTEDVSSTPEGPYTLRLDLEDYREVEGLKFAFRMKRTEKGSVVNIRLTQVTLNPPLDDSLFLKPDFAK